MVEHLPDPAGELIELQRILKPDGALVAEVPNIDSWMFAIGRQDWFPLDIPRHLQHFTPRTLDRLLSKGGFTVVDRQNFHLTDPALVALSLLQRGGVLRRGGGGGQMVEDFHSISPGRKAVFALMAPFTLLVSAGLSPLLSVVSGNSETVTVTGLTTGE